MLPAGGNTLTNNTMTEQELQDYLSSEILTEWTVINEEPFKYAGDEHFSYNDIIKLLKHLQCLHQ